tara:strand:+ start:264 stop:476 length:213 start_codon:yes stop_codon:yes gene_type:complete
VGYTVGVAGKRRLKMSEYRNRTICVDKHEIVVDRVHEIHIAIWQGNVIQVDGLPDEWEYTVHDWDQDADE